MKITLSFMFYKWSRRTKIREIPSTGTRKYRVVQSLSNFWAIHSLNNWSIKMSIRYKTRILTTNTFGYYYHTSQTNWETKLQSEYLWHQVVADIWWRRQIHDFVFIENIAYSSKYIFIELSNCVEEKKRKSYKAPI